MSVPRFQPSGGGLFYLQDVSAGVSGYQAAFLPAEGDAPAGSPSLVQTWQRAKPGLYLFLNRKPSDEAGFIGNVRRYLRASGYRQTRFLWIADPDASNTAWTTFAIPVAAGGKLGRVAELRLRNYILKLDADCTAAPDGAGIAITRPASQPALSLLAGGHPAGTAGTTVTLPFAGPSVGCLGFPLTLAKSTATDGSSDLDRLKVGLRYCYQDDWGYVALPYRVFDAGAAIAVDAVLDPLNPEIGDRTHFSFLAGGKPPASAIGSHFLTWVGRPVALMPLAGGKPRLVLADDVASTGGPAYYLTPGGSFGIEIDPAFVREAVVVRAI